MNPLEWMGFDSSLLSLSDFKVSAAAVKDVPKVIEILMTAEIFMTTEIFMTAERALNLKT